MFQALASSSVLNQAGVGVAVDALVTKKKTANADAAADTNSDIASTTSLEETGTLYWLCLCGDCGKGNCGAGTKLKIQSNGWGNATSGDDDGNSDSDKNEGSEDEDICS